MQGIVAILRYGLILYIDSYSLKPTYVGHLYIYIYIQQSVLEL